MTNSAASLTKWQTGIPRDASIGTGICPSSSQVPRRPSRKQRQGLARPLGNGKPILGRGRTHPERGCSQWQVPASAQFPKLRRHRQLGCCGEECFSGRILQNLRQESLTNLVKELHSWRRGFSRRADRQIDLLIQGTVGSLRRQIPNFAELNCENENIEQAWSAKIKSASIERKVRETQQKLAEECQQYFKTMLKEMREEFRLLEINIGRVSIETGPIRDYRRWWNWGVAGVGALGTVAVFNFWNPVGWGAGAAVAAIGIGSFVAGLLGRFFTSRDQRRREAISGITRRLRNHLNDVEGQIRDDMRRWLDEFTRENVNKATEQINSMKQATAQSAALMRNTVRGQRNALLELNLEIIRLGLQHTGHADEILKITRGARIPGQAQALLTSAPLSAVRHMTLSIPSSTNLSSICPIP